MSQVDEVVNLLPSKYGLKAEGKLITCRIAWILQQLSKKVKLAKKDHAFDMNRSRGESAFSRLLADVALIDHIQLSALKTVKLEPIKDPVAAGYIYTCIDLIENMTKKPVAELAERALILSTGQKRRLFKIGLDFIDTIACTEVSGIIQQ